MEFHLFFAIGLGILVFEAHRQFNHPAYSKSPDDETGVETKGDYIFSLSPSEIRSRSAFFSAELVYIVAIVVMFLALVYSDAVNNVLKYIIGFLGQGAPGGEVSGPATAADAAARPVTYTSGDAAIDKAAEPFVVSMMMVTALRFPLVRRLEVMLRGAAQGLFGIPRIPHRLRQNIQDTPIDLSTVTGDLGEYEVGRSYLDRIELCRERALKTGASRGRTGDLATSLSKMAAYQLWVNELRVWPSQEFRSDYAFFHDLNEPLSRQIDTLFKDCDLLASSGNGEGEANEERQKMRRELWELKAKQAAELAGKLAAMMALYDQNSKWPETDRPGAKSLRAFLDGVRAPDQERVLRTNVAISLILISAGVSYIAGYVYAGWLESIARTLGLYEQVGPNDPQFDRFLTARNFMLSSLIVYGMSMWTALAIRGRMHRNGRWTNPFEAGRQIPPMGQLALLFGVLAVLVFTANLTYLLLTSPGWSAVAERNAGWWGNVQTQADLSILFAIIGAFHGTAVTLMMDLGARKVGGRGWLLVAGGYIAAMMLLGYGLGQYYSTGSHAEIRAMREMLYAVDLGLIALFTSIAMISFLRPEEKKAAETTNKMAAEETLA